MTVRPPADQESPPTKSWGADPGGFAGPFSMAGPLPLGGYGYEPYSIPPRPPDDDSVELVIYLDEYEQRDLETLEEGAMALAGQIGYGDFTLIDERFGSIFKRWKGTVKRGVTSDQVKEAIAAVEDRIRIELIEKSRAEVDAINANSVATVLSSLENTPSAATRIGGLLIIKYPDANGDPVVLSRNLSPREIRALERYPGIQAEPRRTLQLLATVVASEPNDPLGPLDDDEPIDRV